MKKSFEYDLTKYDPNAPTKTEQFLTADGVKTLTTDANNGAVLIKDEVDEDSLNPVTGAAVAAAVASASGEVPVISDDDNGKVLTAVVDGSSKSVEWATSSSGTEYSAGNGIDITAGTISAKVDGTTIQVNASGELEAIGGGGGGSLPTPTSVDALLGATRNAQNVLEPSWKSGTDLEYPLNVAGANTWHAKSYGMGESDVEWTVNVASNVITLTPSTKIVPNNRASHFYIQVLAQLQQLSSGWTGGLIHADVDFKYKCRDMDPNNDWQYAYDRHRVVRVTQYESTQWPQLQIAAELLLTDFSYSTHSLFDMSGCGVSQVTITITDDNGTALPLYADMTQRYGVLAWLD